MWSLPSSVCVWEAGKKSWSKKCTHFFFFSFLPCAEIAKTNNNLVSFANCISLGWSYDSVIAKQRLKKKKKHFSHSSFEKSRSYLTSAARIKYLKVHNVSGGHSSSLTCLNPAAKSWSRVCQRNTEQGGFPHSPRAGKSWPVTHSAVIWGLKAHICADPELVWVQNWCSCTFTREVGKCCFALERQFHPKQLQWSYTSELQVSSTRERWGCADKPRASHTVLITASTQAKPQASRNKPKTSSRTLLNSPLHFPPQLC